MSEPTVGVAIPSIPPRKVLLGRAMTSVFAQDRPVDHISIAVDVHHEGAARTRNRAWRALPTDYVAFLDDDDEFLPMHVGRLLEVALQTDAEMVYSWFEIVGGTDPFLQADGSNVHFTDPWDPTNPRQTTICCLWKRDALKVVGGFPEVHPETGIDSAKQRIGEDFLAVVALNNRGGKIVHVPNERTFRWHHHNLFGGNTSGMPDRW